jgi:glycosyltransferase involved in cell wall biosynthesis
MSVHHNTADPDRFAPGEKTRLILFAGRWTEKKGIDTLIAALARLGPKLDGWRVRLVGDGELKEPLVAQLKAAGVKAELPGWVPADEMPKQFAQAMIHCVPSRRAASGDAEGLPLVCIEAMLSSCALLATRHAGITECVRDGETGCLVDEGDDEALAERLGRMIADPAATLRMGEAGRAFALCNFTMPTSYLGGTKRNRSTTSSPTAFSPGSPTRRKPPCCGSAMIRWAKTVSR